jgi:Leucine-rich repeat (LRR) protein
MEFNIEDYINSLPLDTIDIDVSGKGLTVLPDLTRFKQLTYLNCSDNLLTELPPLNNTLKVLDCSLNQLTELPPLNDNLTFLECSYNQLTKLPSLNNNLQQIYCYHNELSKIPPLNNNLVVLECSLNQLTELPVLNNKLVKLYCYNIKIYNIEFDRNNTKIIQILRNFRNTYYLLKFKKHFKRWLWEKVREPKIMAKFHPSYLDELLETDDLEVFLEDWINE